MKAIGEAIARGALAMAGRRSPWGGGDKGGEQGSEPGGDRDGGPTGEPSGGDEPASRGPRNPWLPGGESTPPRRSASSEDILRSRQQSRRRGGGGGGFPDLPRRPDGKSWAPLIAGGVVAVWLLLTVFHMIGPKEEAVVTTFGKYTRTVGPGVTMTMPWPIQDIDVTDVTSIRRDSIPADETQKLMLTSDKNLVDLSYLVRWNVKDLMNYKFRLDDPDATVKEVAEAAMRATVAEVPLADVIGGTGRGRIEQAVRTRMQAVLDAYKAGVLIQGVELKKTDPPEKVIAAFQNVNVAQQQAEKYQNEARAWSNQVIAIAQGEAASFNKVYGEYKLAPEVTRRRIYYETMERVLRSNDKVVIEANGVTPYLPLPEVRRTRPSDTPPAGDQ